MISDDQFIIFMTNLFDGTLGQFAGNKTFSMINPPSEVIWSSYDDTQHGQPLEGKGPGDVLTKTSSSQTPKRQKTHQRTGDFRSPDGNKDTSEEPTTENTFNSDVDNAGLQLVPATKGYSVSSSTTTGVEEEGLGLARRPARPKDWSSPTGDTLVRSGQPDAFHAHLPLHKQQHLENRSIHEDQAKNGGGRACSDVIGSFPVAIPSLYRVFREFLRL